MQISLPDIEAGPDSDTVEQALECADLQSGIRDCSVSWCAQGCPVQDADCCSRI